MSTELDERIWGQVYFQIFNQVIIQVTDHVWNQIDGQVGYQIRDQVGRVMEQARNISGLIAGQVESRVIESRVKDFLK